jgi:HNH endonuclease
MNAWGDLEERFRSKVRVATSDECWEWTAARDRDGYGEYFVDRPRTSAAAHRYVFERVIGPIPLGLCVLHRCDVPACVNPKHLFLGTQGTNVRDCSRKGRRAKGEKNSVAKLRQSEVEMLRRIHGEMEVTHGYLARLYGVSRPTVTFILHRATWQHVA